MLVKLDSNRKLSCAVILLLFAIVFQIVIIYYVQEDQDYHEEADLSNISTDARSAITRAKSVRCKEELKQFVFDHRHERPIAIKRSCPKDNNQVERVKRLGCIGSKVYVNYSTTSQFVKVHDEIQNLSSCTLLCFSYGHSHAGYKTTTQECWCADNLDLPAEPENDSELESRECHLEWFLVNNGLHTPTKNVFNLSKKKQQVRILFLLSLNGRSAIQVLRLLKNIYSKKHYYFVHVDNRQEYLYDKLRSIYQNVSKNILFANRRYETIWGGPALLAMMIEAMAQTYDLNWHYLINLSETDFPIKNLADLEQYLSERELDSIYLKSHNMKGYSFIKKQGLNYNFYQCESHAWRLGKRQLPQEIVFSGGSDWVGLPKGFCDYILEEGHSDTSLVSSLLQLYNFTLLPAESFFHTLALNSEFCDKFVDNNLRVTNWHRKQGCKCQHKDVVDWCGCSPLVYRWSDWPRLEQLVNSSESLFISRKFDPTISARVISAVESLITAKGEEEIDSRYWLNVLKSTQDKLGSPRTYERFGELSREQVKMHVPRVDDSSLSSVDMYYKDDLPIGRLYRYCAPAEGAICYQLLIEQQGTDAKQRRFNQECLKAQDRRLLALDVNHGFDTGERMFRNPAPLGMNSEIVVLHEWSVVRPPPDEDIPHTTIGKILFKWIDPTGRVELVQEIKLKTTTKLNRLSLVHRLVHENPLAPGLWRLVIQDGDEDCLEHRFLIFGDHEANMNYEPSQDQRAFDELYKVTNFCIENGESMATGQDCQHQEWSLAARDQIQDAYSTLELV